MTIGQAKLEFGLFLWRLLAHCGWDKSEQVAIPSVQSMVYLSWVRAAKSLLGLSLLSVPGMRCRAICHPCATVQRGVRVESASVVVKVKNFLLTLGLCVIYTEFGTRFD